MAMPDGFVLPNSTVPTVLRERDGAVSALAQAISMGDGGLANVPGLLKRVIREHAWQERHVHQTNRMARFASFTEFLDAPGPEGLRGLLKSLKQLCADDHEALDLLDQAITGQHGGDRKSEEAIKSNNVNLDRNGAAPKGNTRQYALRRLRKERPDLHEQVVNKERSAHAAMKEAGFRKDPSALDLLKKGWGKATPAEQKAFLRWTEQTPA